MRVAGVIFDLDGIVFDTERIYSLAWQRALALQEITFTDHDFLAFAGRTNHDCEQELAKRYGQRFSLGRFRSEWPPLWRHIADLDGIPLKPGVLELLDLLEKHKIPKVIASSSDTDDIIRCLRAHNLVERFASITSGLDVSRGKPAPDIFLLAVKKLGMPAKDCLVLEDSNAGVMAAHRAEIPVICIPDLQVPSPETVKIAHRVIASMHEVPALIDLR